MLKNLLTLAISVLISLLFAEFAVRIVFDPVDYLAVDTVDDPVLNHRIEAGASGHDDWGFRNKDVPESAEIIAIGDSMTYGVMAKSFEAWPAQLGERTGKTVYNAALGGYGPLHYLHILKSRAPELAPDQAVVMVYLGNDLLDTYNLAYSNDTWADYRLNAKTEKLDPSLFLAAPGKTSLTRRLRSWFAHNSVLYRIVSQTGVFNPVREQELLERSDTSFPVEHLGTTIVLDPARRLWFADANDPRIREAVKITDRALREMADWCAENGIAFHVALMPVREHVFHDLTRSQFSGQNAVAMTTLRDSLETIERDLVRGLNAAGIAHTNLRAPLQDALRTTNIYPPTDGHPNALGYGVVAAALARELP